jgi:hypothetical protein
MCENEPMNERKRIEDRIRKKEEEAQALEAQARDARVYVKALQDVLKMLPREPESSSESPTNLRPGSSATAARDIILKQNAPVHISELLREMGRELTRENRASLASSLAAYVRKGEIFTRPAPNKFGLIELGHSTGEENDPEPPEGFGEIDD